MVFLDPTVDIAFKKLFGDQKHQEIIINFLNTVLELQDADAITSVTITDPANHPDTIGSKVSFVDVRCEDQNKKKFIVEMQIRFQSDFIKRSQYYTAKTFAQQLKKGASFSTLKPVVFVAILDFNLFNEDPSCISHHKILNVKTLKHDLSDLSFCFIELPKFIKGLNELVTVEDKWIYLLKNASDLKTVPQELKNPTILEEAMGILEEGAFSPEELAAYEKMIDDRRTEDSIFASAELRGEQRGELRGELQGELRGELQKAQAIARVLLTKNMSHDEVAQITGLSVEEVASLLKKS